MTYSRENPSPRFRELLGFYARMHSEGDQTIDIPAEEMFDGRSLSTHISTIRSLLKRFGARTLLDYGAGKAKHYDKTEFALSDGRKVTGLRSLWNLDEVRLYDPGYEPNAGYPTGTFDAVICTDVLEHIPEQDLDWVISDLFGFARSLVYAGVATYAAGKLLPDGSNAHVTLKPAEWWLDKFQACRAASESKAEFALLVERLHNDPKPAVFISFPPS
jgi:hypothetical protein